MSRACQTEMRYIRPAPLPHGAGLAGKYKADDPVMDPDYYKKARHLLTDPRTVTIVDARDAEPEGLAFWKFDKHGLCCITPPEPVDFNDEKVVVEEYYPKLKEIVKETTGCLNVHINSHLIRMPDPPMIFQNPSKFAHCDASKHGPPSWHKFLVKKYGYTEAESQAVDVCMVNVWHPRDHPAYKDPLCLLDGFTVDLENELQDIPMINARGEVNQKMALLVGPSYNPKHRWVYIPDQKPDEAWLFKQYDERDGVAKQAFHNSFVDPYHLNDPSIPGRHSVEFRMYLTFPKKSVYAKL